MIVVVIIIILGFWKRLFYPVDVAVFIVYRYLFVFDFPFFLNTFSNVYSAAGLERTDDNNQRFPSYFRILPWKEKNPDLVWTV